MTKQKHNEWIIRKISWATIDQLRGFFNCKIKVSKNCLYDKNEAKIVGCGENMFYISPLKVFENEVYARNLEIEWVEE